MKAIKTAAIAALALGLAALSNPAQAQTDLRIGLLLSLTGPAAPFGIPERDAVELLAKKINADGGVSGRKISLHIYDEQTNPTESARGLTQLTQQDKVVAIIGSTIGGGTLAAGPVAMRYEVPMLVLNGTVEVTSKSNAFYPWIFRALTSDTLGAEVMLKRSVADGAKKIAIFYQEDAYGKSIADHIKSKVAGSGAEIVDMAAAPLRTVDVTAQATKLRNAKPDVVLLGLAAPALGVAFVQAAKQVGLDVPVWGTIGLGQKAFIDNAGAAAEGVRLTLIANWDRPTPKLQELAKLLEAGGKTPAGFGEVIATNGLLAIVAAAKTIKGEITGSNLRDALEKVCKLKTYAEGSACYSADDHDGWSPDLLTLAQVKGGKFEPIK